MESVKLMVGDGKMCIHYIFRHLEQVQNPKQAHLRLVIIITTGMIFEVVEMKGNCTPPSRIELSGMMSSHSPLLSRLLLTTLT